MELLWLRLANVRLHTTPRRAEWRLGSTETDIRGTRKSRVYECACTVSGGDLSPEICPACVLAELVTFRRQEGADDAEFLFIDSRGWQCSDKGVVKSWNLIVQGHITDDLGAPMQRLVSKHSARRAGAQLLTKRHRSLAEVQYMGRWGGQTVERYVAEAAAMLASHCGR